MTEIDILFNQVEDIISSANAKKEEKRKRGDSFNVFDVLGLSTSEVRTHSALLAELLNPKGTHGLGAFPLEVFVSIVKQLCPIKEEIDIDADNSVVKKEWTIGKIDKNYDDGGQIDILIESKSNNCAIIIENKIYAADQYKQLLRYYSYAQKKYKAFALLYLTLDGHGPDRVSISDDKKELIKGSEFFCISYKDHIIPLLNACKQEAANKPLIRETLTQYIYLLLILTHTDMATEDKEKLLTTMFEHAECVSEIINYRDSYLNEAVEKYFIPQLKKLATKHNLTMGSEIEFLSRKNLVGIDFTNSQWNNLMIRLECSSSNWRDVFVGVIWKDKKRKEVSDTINTFSCLSGKDTLWVGGWKYLSPRKGGFIDQIDEIFSQVIEESKGRDM